MNEIVIKPSKYFVVLHILLHLGAVISLVLLNLTWEFKLLLISICSVNFVYVMYRHVFLYSKKSIIKIWYGAKNDWYLLNRVGEKMLGEIIDNSLVTRFLLILHYKVAGKRRKISVVIFRDIITKDDLRRLRVHLFKSA